MSRHPYRPPKNQRLPDEMYELSGFISFITINAYYRGLFFNTPALCTAVIDVLRERQEKCHCTVYAYCLMPDHIHYLISPTTDGHSVLEFTHQFKGDTTNMSWKYGHHGKLWQPRFYDHIAREDEDLREIRDYILDNPKDAGLVERSEDWPYSGEMHPLPLW